jgi:hypothetical protein
MTVATDIKNRNNSSPLLAKLLAAENITVRYAPNAKTAMFDLKNRILIMPVWKDVSQDLDHMLLGHETGHALDTPSAEEYKAAYEGIAKRVFGAKSTPRKERAIASFLNVIEDARIDKRQKRRFPGLRKNYLQGYKELIDRNFFGTLGQDVNTFVFIDRLNLYLKGGAALFNMQFSPAEKVLLKKVEDLEKWDKTVELTEEIYRFCKDEIEGKTSGGDLSFEEGEGDEDGDAIEIEIEVEGSGSGEGSSGEGSSGEGSGKNEGSGKSQGAGESEEKSESKEDKSEEGKSKTKIVLKDKPKEQNGSGDESGDGAGSGKDKTKGNNKPSNDKSLSKPNKGAGSSGAGTISVDSVPEAATDFVYSDKIGSLALNSNDEYVYVDFPEPNMQNIVHPYKRVMKEWKADTANDTKTYTGYNLVGAAEINRLRVAMNTWRRSEKDTISFLVKEFEARKSAELYSRLAIARTGVIDSNKLHSYRYNDDIFRKLSVIPEGKNHGFVMFIDWSGSMDSAINETIKQLLTLVLFCKQIQVPFEVYAFKDSMTDRPWNYTKAHRAVSGNSKVDGTVQVSNLCLRQFLSSAMSTNEFNDALTYMWAFAERKHISCDLKSGTPLNEAILVAPDIVNDFRKKYKLEIVNTIFLTDGGGNNFNGLYGSRYSRRSFNGGQIHHFYTDKQTGMTVELDVHGYDSYKNTHSLLKILKARTDCNLIGFFLFEGSLNGINALREDKKFNDPKIEDFWNKNNYLPVKSAGYDEYYYINTRKLRDAYNKQKFGDAFNGTKNTRALTKAFGDFAAKKKVSRVLLRNFIDHITGWNKKNHKQAGLDI